MRVTLDFDSNAEAAAFFAELSALFASAKIAVSRAAGTVARAATDVAAAAVEAVTAPAEQRTPFNVDDIAVPASDIPTVPDSLSKRKRGRPPKDHQAPLAAPAVETPAVSEPAPPVAAPAKPAVAIEDLRSAGNALVAKKGANALLDILGTYKNDKGEASRRYPDVPVDKWPELLGKLQAATA